MQAGHDLGEQGFLGGAVAEVAGDRLDQRLFLAQDQLTQGLEPGAALLGRGHGVGAVGGALGGQQRLQSLYLLLVLLEIGNVGDHGGVLSGSGGMEWNDF